MVWIEYQLLFFPWAFVQDILRMLSNSQIIWLVWTFLTKDHSNQLFSSSSGRLATLFKMLKYLWSCAWDRFTWRHIELSIFRNNSEADLAFRSLLGTSSRYRHEELTWSCTIEALMHSTTFDLMTQHRYGLRFLSNAPTFAIIISMYSITGFMDICYLLTCSFSCCHRSFGYGFGASAASHVFLDYNKSIHPYWSSKPRGRMTLY